MVLSKSGGYTGIWLYPKKPSMKDNILSLIVTSTIWIIHNNRKRSFRKALFKFVKST